MRLAMAFQVATPSLSPASANAPIRSATWRGALAPWVLRTWAAQAHSSRSLIVLMGLIYLFRPSTTAVVAPVAIPFEHRAGCHHRAAEIRARGQRATQAPVRLPPADPVDTQRMGPLATMTWPVGVVPRGPPRISTSASRAAIALASGQGWFVRHVPSISRAAIPEIRRRGPSAHQTGPSPSQTRVGVQVKVCPAATIEAARARSMGPRLLQLPSEPKHAAHDVHIAPVEAVPARISGIVARHRDPAPAGFDRDAFDRQRIVHAQYVDPITQA
jgi:hypothetical protein